MLKQANRSMRQARAMMDQETTMALPQRTTSSQHAENVKNREPTVSQVPLRYVVGPRQGLLHSISSGKGTKRPTRATDAMVSTRLPSFMCYAKCPTSSASPSLKEGAYATEATPVGDSPLTCERADVLSKRRLRRHDDHQHGYHRYTDAKLSKFHRLPPHEGGKASMTTLAADQPKGCRSKTARAERNGLSVLRARDYETSTRNGLSLPRARRL